MRKREKKKREKERKKRKKVSCPFQHGGLSLLVLLLARLRLLPLLYNTKLIFNTQIINWKKKQQKKKQTNKQTNGQFE